MGIEFKMYHKIKIHRIQIIKGKQLKIEKMPPKKQLPPCLVDLQLLQTNFLSEIAKE